MQSLPQSQLENINDAFDLLLFLKSKNLLKHCRDPYWWENSGSFEVVVGAILVQNTKWESVKVCLSNLRKHGLLSLNALANLPPSAIESHITKSGFFRQKALRLQRLSQNILENFGDFAGFKAAATREWLLSQKGVGAETCDSILNYALYREILVVDAYTRRLLAALGYEFERYEDLQEWLENGLRAHANELFELYGTSDFALIFARFHGKIVEFCKAESKNPSRESKRRI